MDHVYLWTIQQSAPLKFDWAQLRQIIFIARTNRAVSQLNGQSTQDHHSEKLQELKGDLHQAVCFAILIFG